MKDFFIDCIMDTVKMIPFLLVAFLIIELIEHKLNDKSKKLIEKSGKFGPLLGGILGAFPQCGFSVLTTNLYITRIVSIGTLIAVYLSTSDEMIPVLLSSNVPLSEVIKIVLLKVIIGIIFGFIIDLIFRKKRKKQDYHICDDDTCDCDESIVKSTIKHTLKTSIFIFTSVIIIGLIIELFDQDKISLFLSNHKVLAPMISSLIGLVPNCAASIFITQLYVKGILSFGTTMAGLLTGSGVGILLLFKNNSSIKESIFIAVTIYLIGVVMGLFINVIGVL